MRATEIIRGLLDLIDQLDRSDRESLSTHSLGNDVEQMARYELIQDLLPDSAELSNPVKNSPNPRIADIAAVTTQSGTDLNKAKNPSDIRGEHVSMYPQYQYNPKE